MATTFPSPHPPQRQSPPEQGSSKTRARPEVKARRAKGPPKGKAKEVCWEAPPHPYLLASQGEPPPNWQRSGPAALSRAWCIFELAKALKSAINTATQLEPAKWSYGNQASDWWSSWSLSTLLYRSTNEEALVSKERAERLGAQIRTA